MTFTSLAVAAVRDALAILFPVDCAGCGGPDRSLCAGCSARLREAVAIGPSVLRPLPSVSSLSAAERSGSGEELRLWSAFEYGGIVRGLIHELKEAGRADIARQLGRYLQLAFHRAATEPAVSSPQEGSLFVLAVPSSAESLRRRGYNPVELLLRGAGAGAGASFPRAGRLRYARRVRDQAGLGRNDRWANLEGALTAPRSVAGRRIILVDDVVTTGATLFECRRAVTAEGGIVIAGACLARTRKVKGTSSEFDGDF